MTSIRSRAALGLGLALTATMLSTLPTAGAAAPAAAPAAPAAPGSTGRSVVPTLVARATLSADFIAPGPPSGALATPANGRTGPFPGQVIPGFSAMIENGDGTFWAQPDNGFGTQGNSADFLLRLYKVKPAWETADGGAGEGARNDGSRVRAGGLISRRRRPCRPRIHCHLHLRRPSRRGGATGLPQGQGDGRQRHRAEPSPISGRDAREQRRRGRSSARCRGRHGLC